MFWILFCQIILIKHGDCLSCVFIQPHFTQCIISFNTRGLLFTVDVSIVAFRCLVQVTLAYDRVKPFQSSCISLSRSTLFIFTKSSWGKVFCVCAAGHLFHLFVGGVFKAKIFFFFFLTHLIEAAHWSLILRDRTVTKQTAIGAVTYGSPLKEQQEAADKMQTYSSLMSLSTHLVSLCLPWTLESIVVVLGGTPTIRRLSKWKAVWWGQLSSLYLSCSRHPGWCYLIKSEPIQRWHFKRGHHDIALYKKRRMS